MGLYWETYLSLVFAAAGGENKLTAIKSTGLSKVALHQASTQSNEPRQIPVSVT